MPLFTIRLSSEQFRHVAFGGNNWDPEAFAFSADGRLLAVLDCTSNLTVYDTSTLLPPSTNPDTNAAARLMQKIPPPCRTSQTWSSGKSTLSFSPRDPSLLMVCCMCQGHIPAYVVNVALGSVVATFPLDGTRGRVCCACWTHDGQHLIIGSSSGSLSSYNAADSSFERESVFAHVSSRVTSMSVASLQDQEQQQVLLVTTRQGILAVYLLCAGDPQTFYYRDPKTSLKAILHGTHRLQPGSSAFCTASYLASARPPPADGEQQQQEHPKPPRLIVAVGCEGHVSICEPFASRFFLRQSLGVNSTVEHLIFLKGGALFVSTSCGRVRVFADPVRDSKPRAESKFCHGAVMGPDGHQLVRAAGRPGDANAEMLSFATLEVV